MSAPALDQAREVPRGGTRWRRTALVLVPGLIAAAGLILSTLRGGIPINLVVVGQDLKLTSNGGLVELPRGITLTPSTIRMKNAGATRGVVIAALPEAILTKGLCISLVLTFPGVGAYTVRLHTDGRTTAKDMTMDAAGIQVGSARLSAASSGADPILIGPGSGSLTGDRFGVVAPGAGTLTALAADAQGAVIAGTVDLKGLSVDLSKGDGLDAGECY
ncbi:MAG: DUF6230 family protein [Sporichthyaceae bacterium]